VLADRGTPSGKLVLGVGYDTFDILPALKREDSHGTAPLSWDIVVYDVARS